MTDFKYPAKFRHNGSETAVLFTANKVGTVVNVGDDSNRSLGEYRTDWTGPEFNSSWVLMPELSTKRKLHEAVSKFKQSN